MDAAEGDGVGGVGRAGMAVSSSREERAKRWGFCAGRSTRVHGPEGGLPPLNLLGDDQPPLLDLRHRVGEDGADRRARLVGAREQRAAQILQAQRTQAGCARSTPTRSKVGLAPVVARILPRGAQLLQRIVGRRRWRLPPPPPPPPPPRQSTALVRWRDPARPTVHSLLAEERQRLLVLRHEMARLESEVAAVRHEEFQQRFEMVQVAEYMISQLNLSPNLLHVVGGAAAAAAGPSEPKIIELSPTKAQRSRPPQLAGSSVTTPTTTSSTRRWGSPASPASPQLMRRARGAGQLLRPARPARREGGGGARAGAGGRRRPGAAPPGHAAGGLPISFV